LSCSLNDEGAIVEAVGRRALLALAAASVGVACTLSGLDGVSGGTDPIEAGTESGGPPDSSEADSPTFDAGGKAGLSLDGGCQGAADCARVFFVTHDEFATSDFGSLAGADALCEQVANSTTAIARVRGRPMRAWLSDGNTSAAERLVHGTMRYVLTDNRLVASNWSQLVSGTLDANTDVDETGQALAQPAVVWTGTQPDGASDDMLCGDWASSSMTENGVTGFTVPAAIDAGGEVWTFRVDTSCNEKHHLYCIER
jgi:hypothetical protein